MRTIRWIGRRRVVVSTALGVMLALAVGGGCQSAGQRRTALAEPGLSGSVEGGSTLASTPPPATSVTWVDRHPLFSKPRDLYETTNSNKVVKTAAAAVVGIPVGFFGELRQIVVGNPSGSVRY